MPIRVRRGTADDVETAVEFNRLMALESENKVLDLAELRPGVAALLSDETKGLYFFAESDGIVVGQLAVTYEWSDWRNGAFWWIQSVYVDAQHRRRGIFRTLLHHVQETAAQTPQVIGIRLYVDHENAAAQRTYRNLGLATTGYLVMEQYPLPGKG